MHMTTIDEKCAKCFWFGTRLCIGCSNYSKFLEDLNEGENSDD